MQYMKLIYLLVIYYLNYQILFQHKHSKLWDQSLHGEGLVSVPVEDVKIHHSIQIELLEKIIINAIKN